MDEYLQMPNGGPMPRPFLEPLPVEPLIDSGQPTSILTPNEAAPVSSGEMEVQDVSQ